MKLTFLFLVAGLMQLSASVYSQTTRLSLDMEDAKVAEVLDAIENQSEFRFAYSPGFIDLDRKVTFKIQEKTIEESLTVIFAGTGVEFGVYDRHIILYPEAMYTNNLKVNNLLVTGQQRSVSGKVTDFDGQPLPGVTVVVKGTTQGTVTNANGEYSMANIPEDVILVFSFVGMRTQEIPLEGRTTLTVVMEEETIGLDEVVAVGYGTQSREILTTSVTKLDTKVLENTTFGNAASALQGTVSGVRVQTLSGQPGASPRIIVRGGTSINSPDGATPLYVIDGVIREDMDGINTSDIESMQVLKDAAATAIYGARASNGVVIVTLKKGAAGKTVISYSYTFGMSQLRDKYDVLSARDYIYYGRLGLAAIGEKHPERLPWLEGSHGQGIGNDLTNNTAFTPQYLTSENEYKLNEGWESMPDPLDPSKTIIFSDTDWQDILFRTGISNDHYLSFAGGSEKATFNMGIGYSDIEGIAIHTDYKRLTTNLNGRLQLKDNLYVYGGLNFSRSSDNEVYSINNLFERSIATPPTAKYKYEDGTLAPGNNSSLGNPEYHMSRRYSKNEENIITISGGMNWQITPKLAFEPTASLFYKIFENNAFRKAYYNTPTQFVDSREASGLFSKWGQQQFDATLSYDNIFMDKHNVKVKLGVSYFEKENRSLSASGKGAATDLIPTMNASAEPVSVYSYGSEQVVFGYFGRITYDFEKRYLVTLNARYDGASNLGDHNKWGFFPGVSVGWNLHNEDFWQNLSTISRFKLRASYGVNGNLGNLSDFQAQGQYSVGATYDGIAAVEYSELANQSLQWEQSKTMDIGFDAGLFDNKVQFIFDYYNRVTDNLITSLALPYLSGFSSIYTNLGSLENSGVEFELGVNVIDKKDFSWNVSINSSLNKNKILELPENDNDNNRIGGYYIYDTSLGDYAWRGGLQEGGRLGELYGYKYLYVYATDEEAAAGPHDELVAGSDKSKFGGDVAWLDKDDNGIIDTKDRVYMGNIYPKWTGGLSSTWDYKGLSLYLRMDYSTGHTIYNYTRANMNGQFVGDINATTDVLRSWLNQGDKTDIPRYYWADQAAQANYWRGDPRNINNGAGSSQNYEKGDYWAIRELTLSYQVPYRFYKDIGLQNLRLNVTGNNLKYFTDYTGFSPEEGGIDHGRYPLPRVIQFGVKASF
ncbi:SusC/RagA family TonB-linked outer membrane protein [Mariniphaga sediminis]|uniref:SusC/RagA family TonB-linked outer membrane protein n=1 Tax=Mariniphaga sediminis TaxID=1628158 RepID=A0A399D1R2_9BACT|nr:TonB-dependent receptor [Mariniphaga sediminis]RIH65517.1 SusC/RagA family TonB-linked outer membrane protein [Mariniphaga sediminis]